MHVCPQSGATLHVLPWQVAELLEQVQAMDAADSADSADRDAAWELLLSGVERIQALPATLLAAGATAPRSLEALRLDARLPGCYNLGWAALVSCHLCMGQRLENTVVLLPCQLCMVMWRAST